MASGVHSEDFELSMKDGLDRSDALQSHSGEDGGLTSATPGRKFFRLVAVSFGLLCILLAALIVSLRLAFSTEASYEKLAEERDELKRINFDIEVSFKNLTEERDELRRINSDTEANYKNLTEERKELKRKLNTLYSQHISLTEERDELKKINSDIEASFKNLTEERDKLKNINFDTEANYKNLTEERKELKRKLNTLYSQHISLTEERDELKRRLKILGWVYFSGSVYYISSTERTWQESRNDCLQKGADLMIINNQGEQNFTRQFKKYMWIGLTDSEREGTWKWVDGTPLTTSFWGSGEPNGNTGENCGETKYPDMKNNWNDEGCSSTHYWICEKKVSP
ncbi:C-type lectin domain family 4 member M-like isoform X2 [Xiphias gladius]|uniref:C-type lectin domain family 4 member M-like isoform X2 n=1 Tax=Xiphias gladius TaxID=8245 RepID=UPI001A98619D|nr:C-type lectin domain family 4 member M-like isoform X2 [Xiphias gladius]